MPGKISFLSHHDSFHHRHFAVSFIFSVIILISFLYNNHDTVEAHIADSPDETVILSIPDKKEGLPTVIDEIIPEPEPVSAPPPVTETVRRGDSLAKIFQRLNISPAILHEIMEAAPDKHLFKQIRPGQLLQFRFSPDHELLSFALELNQTETLAFHGADEGFKTETIAKVSEVREKYIQGSIEDSFYLAAKTAGLADKLIMELADIFAWDIDFAQDIRRGDRFEVLYEEQVLDQGSVVPGKILAARFVNQSHSFSAIEFTTPEGKSDYYTPEGLSMRKAFKRSPIDFARVSSHFNLRRKHPVLHTIRAHKGVDYAASQGTAIKATGNGKVIFVGRKGGYGNVVILQHGQDITTLYAHMQRFASSIRVGARVRQDQVIGYVGSSGLATGPHLHYEFRIAGAHKNPLTVKLPNAQPINTAYKDAFTQHATRLTAQLDLQKQTLARNE